MSGAIFVSLVVARWAQFLSLFVLFGALLFPFYVTRTPPTPTDARLASSLRRSFAVAGTVQILSILAWAAASIASMGDGWSSLGDSDFVKAFFFEASFGWLWLARLG